MRRTIGYGLALSMPVLLLAAGAVAADERPAPDVSPSAERVARQVLGPDDGWASAGAGTTGGSAATADQVHVVSDYAQLQAALAGGRANDTPKIVFIDGTIDANTDEQGRPVSCDHYADPDYDFAAYLAEYGPENWGTDEEPHGPLEDARARSQDNQGEQIIFEIGSNTTLIGLGDDARLLGAQMMVESVHNVIIRNISFENAYDCFPQWDPTDTAVGNWNSEFDNVSVRRSTNVWIDHNEFSDGDLLDRDLPEYLGREYQQHDGLLDITHGADLVTVSYNHLYDHDKTMLIGSTDSPTHDVGKLRVTLHHNKWEDILQRAPRVRYGQVHIYNNHYVIPRTPPGEKVYEYSWGVGVESQIYAENNYFEAYREFDPAEVIAHWKGTAMHESGTYLNGSAPRHRVSLLDAYNAAREPVIGSGVSWTPAHHNRIDPTRSVPATVRKAGTGQIL
ncbi:pectate lyase family protein [Nocardiopsis ansamitocini]|uniref:Pectate lyase n=1 Tax=Nocardiopsis ansamitocini TaxID=1670832 RepID=A0A9W6P4V5_9ACTN|nr:pectate lyase [Nocardiopsis ansamitocini]GLU47250.1 pectate lyase [Nocardiopsis ansamitocini]